MVNGIWVLPLLGLENLTGEPKNMLGSLMLFVKAIQ